MKKQLIILMSIWSLLIVSCQKEEIDLPVDDPSLASEGIPVDISFSILSKLETGSNIEPMNLNGETRAGDEIKAVISNKIKVILAKEVNGEWILDDIFDYKIDPTEKWIPIKHDVTDNSKFDPINMILRPGKYKVTLITGSNSLNWNGELKKGIIVNEGEDAQWACTYRAIDGGYIHAGDAGLAEEIFAASKDFEVKKTDNLHGLVYDNNVSLSLKRKVGKLRFMLKKRTLADPGENADRGYPGRSNWEYSATQDFLNVNYGNAPGISAQITLTDSSHQFCGGLDIWGNPQNKHYLKEEYKQNVAFAVFTWKTYQLGNDGLEYLLGMCRDTRQSHQYYFTKEGDDLPIRVSNISVTFFSNGPEYRYDGIIEEISIKHNSITGLIFESGNWAWNQEVITPNGSQTQSELELLLVKENGIPAKAETKFNNFYESRQQ